MEGFAVWFIVKCPLEVCIQRGVKGHYPLSMRNLAPKPIWCILLSTKTRRCASSTTGLESCSGRFGPGASRTRR